MSRNFKMCFSELSCREAAAASDRRLIRKCALTAPLPVFCASKGTENPQGRLLSRRRVEQHNSWGLLKERTVCCQFIALFYPPNNCSLSSCLRHCSDRLQKHCISFPVVVLTGRFFQRIHVFTATCVRQVKVKQMPSHLIPLNPFIFDSQAGKVGHRTRVSQSDSSRLKHYH